MKTLILVQFILLQLRSIQLNLYEAVHFGKPERHSVEHVLQVIRQSTSTINATSSLSFSTIYPYLGSAQQRTECEIENGPRNGQLQHRHTKGPIYFLAQHGKWIQMGFRMSLNQRVFHLYLCAFIDLLWSYIQRTVVKKWCLCMLCIAPFCHGLQSYEHFEYYLQPHHDWY